jgi:hypothetical protein
LNGGLQGWLGGEHGAAGRDCTDDIVGEGGMEEVQGEEWVFGNADIGFSIFWLIDPGVSGRLGWLAVTTS